MQPLTPEEARIIIHKGTEPPFSGTLLHNTAQGTYVCRQCGTPLYMSADKFASGCGWPSFDEAIAGAVKRVPDADGRRTEIVCSKCNGHLGHIFEGERLTPKNTRHCVNSLSLQFVASPQAKDIRPQQESATTATAYFAGGCFWGVEDAFSKLAGVTDVTSGYMGGVTENPTYQQVCTGETGHAETVKITYDPSKIDFSTLARLFFQIHDPTQRNRQGWDIGTQYRSAVFYTDATQKDVALELVEALRAKGWKVVTELEPAKTFYPAEAYHQDYTARTGQGGCHMRVDRFTISAP